MGLINYWPLVVDIKVELMLERHTMAMIFYFYDVRIEQLDRYSFHHHHHLMGLDMKYHEKLNDRYFDYNVDNQQELEMDRNNDEKNLKERLNYHIHVVVVVVFRLWTDRKNPNHTWMIEVLN
jgi:hypothetical protein